jgi:tetratricopeptide (TPR) repeat protein
MNCVKTLDPGLGFAHPIAMPRLWRTALVVSALFAAPLAGQPGGAGMVRKAGALELHQPVERELGPGQTDVFTIEMTAGQLAHVVAEQKGVDVVVTVLAPKGNELLTADSPNYELGPEPVTWVAEEAGAYTVKVLKSPRFIASGRYRLELTELGAPRERDTMQAQAERLLYRAVDRDRAGGTADVQEALRLYGEAASLWHKLSDPYEEALCLHRTGRLLSGPGEVQKALEVYQRALALWRAAGSRSGEALSLLNTGLIYSASAGQPRKGLEYCLQALEATRAVSYRSVEAFVLVDTASIYYGLNDNQKALEYYQQAVSLSRAVGDRSMEAKALTGLGNVRYALDDNQEALEYYQQALPLSRAVGDRSSEADALTGIGNVYYGLNDSQKALESYRQALALSRAAGNGSGEADALVGLGNVYYRLADNQKALESYQQILPVSRKAGDRSSEASALIGIGNIHYRLGDYQKALEDYQQALPISRAAANHGSEASALISLGNIYYQQGEYPKALESYQQALLVSRAAGNGSGEARALIGLGNVYYRLADNQKALESYQQALPLSRAAGDRAGEASATVGIGNVYSNWGENRKAREYYEQALSLVQALGDVSSKANALIGLGSVYDRLNENQKALESYQQALSLARAMGDRSREGIVLGGLADVYYHRGEKQKALELDEQALSIDRSLGDRASEASVLTNMGGVYSDLQQMQKSLEAGEKALAISRALADRAGEAGALHNLSRVYTKLGEHQKALETDQQALAAYRSVGDRAGVALVLIGLGVEESDLGDEQKALDSYNRALVVYRELGDRSGEANALATIGIVYQETGKNDESLEFFERALPLVRALGDQDREAALLTCIGDSRLRQQGREQDAMEYMTNALPLFRAVGDRSGEAVALGMISRAFQRLSLPDAAILFGKQAVNVLQSVRRDNRRLPDELKRSYAKSIESAYRHLAGLLVERQRFGEAEEVLDLLKDKEASDFIQRDAVAEQLRPATLLGFEKEALARYDQIADRVVALGQQRAALVAKRDQGQPLSAAEVAEAGRLDSDLAAAKTVLLRFLEEQEKTFAPDSALARRTEEFREAEGVQDVLQKLGPDVVAIYTLVMPDKYIAMLVTSGARKAYTTPIRQADLNRKIFAFRQALQNPASDPLPLAQELYRIVFPQGLREDLEAIHARTIMWSIDSTLRYVPIAALHDGKQYLVQRFRNSLITHASLTRLAEPSQGVWQGEGFGVSEAKAGFRALPSVPEELHGIFRQAGTGGAPLSGAIRMDGDFTRDTFENDLRSRRNRVVHIATHFDSEPGVAANSNLLLGDGSKLSLAEIEAQTRLFDGVDLLTLSACSTAFTNGSEDGREVDSFGTIAQRLGARGVIASLWSVNDEATARLMRTMYRLREEHPELGKSEALRRAQEEMVTGTLRPGGGKGKAGRGLETGDEAAAHDWTHPYYWAPFILIGNWK